MRSLTLFALIALFAACDSPDTSNVATPPAAETAEYVITYQPVPRVTVAGEPLTVETMSDYADQLGIPAAAFAIFLDGKLVYEEFKGEDIGPDSLFQGASLAKSITGATVATLALREGISLDEDIASYITSFDLTRLEGYEAPVTLRELLSNTSQADVEGFPGYPQSEELPTNLEIILGSEKSNTEPVAFSIPEGKWYYSGGGFQIAQAFAEDVSGQPFAELAKELVFDPVGMKRSFLAATMDAQAVSPLKPVPGFTQRGPVEGGWHNYPELATAALWTTSADFGKFVIAVMAAAEGDELTGIAPQVARDMLTVAGHPNPVRGYGLGLGILLNEDGTVQSFEHHGANEGFQTSFSAYPKERALAIVMTNHSNGLQLATENNRGFGMSLGYVDPAARTIDRMPIGEDMREQCLGRFSPEDGSGDAVLMVFQDDTIVYRDEDGDYPLVHLGDGDFLYVALEYPFKCETTGDKTTLLVGGSSLYVKDS